MSIFLWMGLIIGTLIVQATVIPLIFTGGIRPDLLLIVTVSAGLLFGKERGVGVGFFAGLIQDLGSGGILGLNTLAKLAIGYLSGMIEQKVFKENIFLPLLTITVATFINSFITYVLLFILGQEVDLAAMIVRNLWPVLFYNILFVIPVHRLVCKVSA